MAINFKKITTILILICLGLKANTQSDGNALNFLVYETKSDQLDPENENYDILKFKNPLGFEASTSHKNHYWIQLDFKNKLEAIDKDTEIYLKLNSFDYGNLYYQDEQGITNKPIGLFNKEKISEKIPLDNYYSQIKITPKNLINNRFLYFKVKRITFNEQIKYWHFNISKQSYVLNHELKDFNALIPYYTLAGLCFLTFFLAISLFLLLRNLAFLYYALYIVLYFVYLAGHNLGFYEFLFNDNYFLSYWFSNVFIFIGHMPYVLYLMYYLNTKTEYPLVHNPLKILIISNVVSIIAVYALYLADYTIALIYILDYGFKMLYMVPVFALFRLIYIGKNHLASFAAIATLSLCFSGLARMYLASPEDGLFLDSQIYAVIGFALEIIVFTFGLNYKFYLDLLEKFKFQQEATKNKTKALRAQINPHFIFNSLSSIQHLITSNDKVSTLKYLSKFSRLTRNILESSIETNVVLEDEIKMLKDYLELESLRFDNAFSYKINIDEAINTNSIEVPFMILQPFIENAIIHGLLNKEGHDKKLNISFKQNLNNLECTIDDNGIGREASGRKKNIHKNKSRGLEVTKERLKIINKTDDNITIIDKIGSNNEPLGTTVIIKINL